MVVRSLIPLLSRQPWSPATLGASLLWDSGEDPAVGSSIPGSVSVNRSDYEVWCVSRGHSAAAYGIGPSGFDGMVYGGSISATATNVVTSWGGGGRTLATNAFWPRVSPTVHRTRYDGANAQHTLNGRVFSAAASALSGTAAGGRVGQSPGGSFTLEGAVRRLLITTRIDATNAGKMLDYLRTTYGILPYAVNVMGCGDSLTAGYNSSTNFILNGWTSGDFTHSYPYYVAQSQPSWCVLNHGITGVTINTMTTNDTTGIDPYYSVSAFANNVAVVWAGTNDIIADGVDLATLQTRVSTYVAARKTAGWKVVYVLMMDRSGFSAGQRTIKDDFNSWVSGGGLGANVDAIVSLPSGLSGNSPWSGSPSLWDSDNTHLSRSGYELIAGSIRTSVASVL